MSLQFLTNIQITNPFIPKNCKDCLTPYTILLERQDNLLIDNQEISNSVREQFFNEQCINKVDVKNYSDGIILIIAMVYDLNFKYSFEYLEKTSLIWKIFSQIEDQERFREYFEYIDKYIKERVKC